ncbi:MAG: dockerin type I repeat-containing protein [Oscillospiraceae bacterium]|jgi:hypothetical protein|nr:dockerin type I repeat-containing protein [Oscillospiraceae bacterium]
MKKFKKITYALISMMLIMGVLSSGAAFFASAEEVVWVMFGDVDFDGFISAGDARAVLRQAGRLDAPFTGLALLAADVDKDGKLTSNDARIILRDSAGVEKITQTPNPYSTPQTAAVILDKIKTLGNSVKTDKIGFKKVEVSEITAVSAKFNNSFYQLMFGSMLKDLETEMKTDPYRREITVANGVAGSLLYQNEFPSEGKSYSIADAFNTGMIKSVSNTATSANRATYTFILKDETISGIHNWTQNTTYETNHGKVFMQQDLYQLKKEFALQDDTMTLTDLSVSYKDSSVKYVFDPLADDGKGKLISAEYTLKWTIKVVMQMQVVGKMTMEVTSVSKETFTF